MEISEKERLVCQAKTEYADAYGAMTWLNLSRAIQAEEARKRMLTATWEQPGVRWEFSQTKLVAHDISPGCTLCGQGDWSCLFINNICNAKCFYCPAPQSDVSQPATGRLEFSDPEDYADYIEAFQIKGVSFSGGEPLISFDRVMAFLTALRKKITRPLYIWMYTNGILASTDKFRALADAGLDEIRFDLSANDYRLEGLKKAVGIIPKVTVEIPAIPEDLGRLKDLLRQLETAGVNFLNLHQIRCTQFNRPKLTRQGYTFVHGPGVTVLETELAALELIQYAQENQITLPVNYCSFTYRHQFQRAGAQKRSAAFAKAGHESITSTGQIRTLSLGGNPEQISRVQAILEERNTDTTLWQTNSKKDQLSIHADLLLGLDIKDLRLKILHSGTSLGPCVSYRHSFKKIDLNPNKTVVVERFPRHQGIVLTGDQIPWYVSRYLSQNPSPGLECPESMPEKLSGTLDSLENFTPGLAPYF